MTLSSRRPKDWQIVQQARADFVINAIRERLPASTLWHEKRFSFPQLESLCIVSTQGVYDVDTFDLSAADFTQAEGFMTIDDLAIRVRHDARSHNGIENRELQSLIRAGNSDFNAALAENRDSITSTLGRVTCVIEYQSPTEDVERCGEELLDFVSTAMQWPLNYVPYITNDIWLPTSEIYNVRLLPKYGRAAGEFVFLKPFAATDATRQVQSFLKSTGTLRLPGIHGTIPEIEYLQDIHMIGRRF